MPATGQAIIKYTNGTKKEDGTLQELTLVIPINVGSKYIAVSGGVIKGKKNTNASSVTPSSQTNPAVTAIVGSFSGHPKAKNSSTTSTLGYVKTDCDTTVVYTVGSAIPITLTDEGKALFATVGTYTDTIRFQYTTTNKATAYVEIPVTIIVEEDDTPEPPPVITPINISFNANGGAWSGGATTQTAQTSGGKVSAPSTDPTYSGHYFIGWYDTSAATGGSAFDPDTPHSDAATYWARWGTEYKVKFHANGGSGTTTDQQSENGFVASLKNSSFTAPTGKSFAGWSTTPGDSNTENFAAGARYPTSGTMTADVDLYAVWSQDTGAAGVQLFLNGAADSTNHAVTLGTGDGAITLDTHSSNTYSKTGVPVGTYTVYVDGIEQDLTVKVTKNCSATGDALAKAYAYKVQAVSDDTDKVSVTTGGTIATLWATAKNASDRQHTVVAAMEDSNYNFGGWTQVPSSAGSFASSSSLSTTWTLSPSLTSEVTEAIKLKPTAAQGTFTGTINVKKDGSGYTNYTGTITVDPSVTVTANSDKTVWTFTGNKGVTYTVKVNGTTYADGDNNSITDANAVTVNYYTVTPNAGSNVDSAYSVKLGDKADGTGAAASAKVFLWGDTAYLFTKPAANYASPATWTNTAGLTLTNSESGGVDKTSFAVKAKNTVTGAYSSAASYTAKVTVHVDGVAKNISKVTLMTSASDKSGHTSNSGSSGVYTFNNVSALSGGSAVTYTHAEVVTETGTYVAALSSNISYNNNTAASHEANVHLQTVNVKTDPNTTDNTAITESGALTATVDGDAKLVAPSGIYDIVTGSGSESRYVFKNWTGGTVAASTNTSTTYTVTAPTAEADPVTLVAHWQGVTAAEDSSLTVKEGYAGGQVVLEATDGVVKNIGYTGVSLATKITDTDSFAGSAAAGGLASKLTAALGASSLNSAGTTTLTVTLTGRDLTCDHKGNDADSTNWEAKTYTAYVWVYDTTTDTIRDRVKIEVTVNPPAGMTVNSNFTWDTYTQTISGSTDTTKTLTVAFDGMTSIGSITLPGGGTLAAGNYTATVTGGGADGATASIVLSKQALIDIAADIRALGGTSGPLTVNARGAMDKSGSVTVSLADSMPTLSKVEFASGVTVNSGVNEWTLGSTFPTLKVTDSNNKSGNQLTGEVAYTWYVNGVAQSAAPTSSDLKVGDVVRVVAAGTGEPYTAKPTSGSYTDLYAKTPTRDNSFRVVPPAVTAAVTVDGSASSATGIPTANATHVGNGVFNATTSGTETKYRFDKWSVTSGAGGFNATSYTDANSSDKSSMFKPTQASTVTANWLTIGHLTFDKGTSASGPSDTNGTEYTDSVTNDGAGAATSVVIALGGTDEGKFDVAFDSTTTSINKDASAPFTVTPKAGTAPAPTPLR